MAAATAIAFDTVTTMGMTGGSSIAWSDLKVTGFPAGKKMSVIHGDPVGTGDYTLRLQFPDGYQFPVHWHPKAEHVTVLSGALSSLRAQASTPPPSRRIRPETSSTCRPETATSAAPKG